MKGRVGKTMGAVALAAASMLMTPLAAQAFSVDDCVALIDALKADTNLNADTNPKDGYSYFKNPIDRSGLTGKLASASSKLTATKGPKIDGAKLNITDYANKVFTLMGSAKTNDTTFQLLYNGLDVLNGPTLHGPAQILNCINNIQ